jgi:hypothetical protein
LTVDGIKNIEDIRVGDWVIADDPTTPGEIEAKDLTVGSLLQTEDGRIVDVDRVQKRERPFEVYNFKVEGIPTYFVSELGVLVHNTCAGGGSPISLDEALERAEQFLEPNVPMRFIVNQNGVQVIQEFANSTGTTVTRRSIERHHLHRISKGKTFRRDQNSRCYPQVRRSFTPHRLPNSERQSQNFRHL